MNYHYIDYMNKARQREILEACERKRLIYSAGTTQVGLFHEIRSGIVNGVNRLRKKLPTRNHSLQPSVSMVKAVTGMKGKNQ